MKKPGTLIREDEQGMFVTCNGEKMRPGEVIGFSHAYQMDAGPLKVGDRAKVSHMSQTCMAKIVCEDGTVLRWMGDGYFYNSTREDHKPKAVSPAVVSALETLMKKSGMNICNVVHVVQGKK